MSGDRLLVGWGEMVADVAGKELEVMGIQEKTRSNLQLPTVLLVAKHWMEPRDTNQRQLLLLMGLWVANSVYTYPPFGSSENYSEVGRGEHHFYNLRGENFNWKGHTICSES